MNLEYNQGENLGMVIIFFYLFSTLLAHSFDLYLTVTLWNFERFLMVAEFIGIVPQKLAKADVCKESETGFQVQLNGNRTMMFEP